jgi:hypothetical protein
MNLAQREESEQKGGAGRGGVRSGGAEPRSGAYKFPRNEALDRRISHQLNQLGICNAKISFLKSRPQPPESSVSAFYGGSRTYDAQVQHLERMMSGGQQNMYQCQQELDEWTQSREGG